jgi:hypothetical protein
MHAPSEVTGEKTGAAASSFESRGTAPPRRVDSNNSDSLRKNGPSPPFLKEILKEGNAPYTFESLPVDAKLPKM